jgi:acyl-CoA dehydrogenase
MNHPPSWMDADLELYRDMVRRFIAHEILPNEKAWADQQHVDRALWTKAGELGILLADVPDQYGGAGGNFAHIAILLEELAYAGTTAFGVHAHAVAAHTILEHGSEEQKRKYLPQLASGDMVAAIATTEPGAGADLRGIRTHAAKAGNGYVIKGLKTFISNGHQADLIIVAAKTGLPAGEDRTSLFLVERRNVTGLRAGVIFDTIGQKGQDTCDLFFEGVDVSADSLLGGVEGAGVRQITSELSYERVMIGVRAAAAIERAVRLTVEYTRERKAFGQALINLQNTRFKLADGTTLAVIARSFIDDCIQRMIEGSMDDVTSSMAKLWLSETEGKVVDECLQLFGGYGYMMEYPISHMYADARAQRIHGGTSESMKETIGRSL